MSSEPLDYYPLLPQELAPKLRDATAAWRSASASQDAILMPLFTGVKGFEPDVFAVRNNVNAIGQAPIPLCQDISSYAQIFASIVGAVQDRNTLATSLQVLVNRWHRLDPNELTSPQTEVARLLQYDASEVKSITAQLKSLSDTIVAWTSDSTDPLFNSSLFDTATHILDPVANFPSTIDGIARFADVVGLPIRAINTPLKKVFQKPIIGNPISSPEAVSSAVTALVERILGYFSHIDKVVGDVDALVLHLNAAASGALLIPKGIEDFAAGQSSDYPVDAGAAEKAWNEAGSAAAEFVSAIVGKTRAAKSSFGNTTFAARLDATPTQGDVEGALGPPSYGASALSALTDQTLGTTAQLTTVLTLPYNSDFKVRVDEAEVSLFEAVLKTKTSYEGIQSRTIPIARDIQTYSLLQKTILPILESDLPVPPTELFSTWAVLAKSYGANATQVAIESQALLEKFKTDVSTLKSNLNEVKARIAADKEELAAAQRAYDAVKAQMLIDGILALVLTAGAIAAAYAGQGELIGELGGKARESLSQVVENDIKAGEIMLLIRRIERIIEIAENTSLQLDRAIPLVVGVVSSMTKIGDVWTDINTSMDIAQSDYTAWRDENLLSAELLTTLASRWETYENEAVRYVDSILGIETPTTANLLSIALSGVSEKDIKSADFGTPSDTDSPALQRFYELDNDPKLRALMAPTTIEERIEKFQLLQASALDSQLYNAIKAPSITLNTNRQSLDNSAASYRQAADIMQSLFPSDANSLRDLASRIGSDVIPPVTDCVDFYKTFADRQVAALSVTPTKARLEDLAAENARYAAQGLQKAQTAQTKVLDFKNRSVLVNNSIIQRGNELQLSMNRARRELEEKKGELAKYEWIQWVPGIGPIIKALIEAITRTEEEISNLNYQIWNLQQASYQVNAARGIEEACLNTIVGLTESWVGLTQEANDLSTYLKLISEVPATAAALADDAKATWISLNANLARW